MDSSASFLRHYRLVTELNNIGVALLEKAAFQQAQTTLKDAIHVMKLVFPSDDEQENSSASRVSNLSHEINVRFESALERLRAPQPFVGTLSSLTTVVDVVSYKEESLPSIERILQQGPSATFAFPIRIDCAESGCPDDEHDIDVESAILLYNFSLCNMCLADFSDTDTAARTLRVGSLKTFRLAESILSFHTNGYNNAFETGTRCMQVAAIILNSIIQLLIRLDQTDQVEENHLKLVRLRNVIHHLMERGLSPGLTVNAAAAA